jgi:hypothetical protein
VISFIFNRRTLEMKLLLTSYLVALSCTLVLSEVPINGACPDPICKPSELNVSVDQVDLPQAMFDPRENVFSP